MIQIRVPLTDKLVYTDGDGILDQITKDLIRGCRLSGIKTFDGTASIRVAWKMARIEFLDRFGDWTDQYPDTVGIGHKLAAIFAIRKGLPFRLPVDLLDALLQATTYGIQVTREEIAVQPLLKLLKHRNPGQLKFLNETTYDEEAIGLSFLDGLRICLYMADSDDQDTWDKYVRIAKEFLDYVSIPHTDVATLDLLLSGEYEIDANELIGRIRLESELGDKCYYDELVQMLLSCNQQELADVVYNWTGFSIMFNDGVPFCLRINNKILCNADSGIEQERSVIGVEHNLCNRITIVHRRVFEYGLLKPLLITRDGKMNTW